MPNVTSSSCVFSLRLKKKIKKIKKRPESIYHDTCVSESLLLLTSPQPGPSPLTLARSLARSHFPFPLPSPHYWFPHNIKRDISGRISNVGYTYKTDLTPPFPSSPQTFQLSHALFPSHWHFLFFFFLASLPPDDGWTLVPGVAQANGIRFFT